jgi:hypothetical protein
MELSALLASPESAPITDCCWFVGLDVRAAIQFSGAIGGRDRLTIYRAVDLILRVLSGMRRRGVVIQLLN